MQGISEDTRRVLGEIARQYGVSEDAALAMLWAVQRGQGTMAQFNIGELGGSGQWMQGGMTMVGDMFNYGLKNTVDGLCNALSQALSSGRIHLPSASGAALAWWPQWLGSPSSTGAQNDSAYAVFPSHRRLAIKDGGGVHLYDTGDHFISGVGQQQGSNTGLTFSSQYGSFSVSSLRRVDDGASSAAPAEHVETTTNTSKADAWSPAAAAPEVAEPVSTEPVAIPALQQPPASPVVSPAAAPMAESSAILALIEKLAALREAGILTEAEFAAKKTELLSRL
ncbi:SHOCT domain-containing protein [Rhizobium sp. CSW-27]|uniref:SHOCT domain-containing protein n=1 Tax=Rhizobium sp. CSW-27 TaxID=2839985 RepID=UPI001C00AA72|nr:SHOCT domain-containing protein [Rhizobium sp. CSW-27]MBT9370955.1 SHOCT domain-containing protein [Rhizobium sp. CSW-27]